MRRVQELLEEVDWTMATDTSLSVFKDMVARYVEWTGHARRRGSSKRADPEADRLRVERDQMAHELQKMKNDMETLRTAVTTGKATANFRTAAQMLLDGEDGTSPLFGASPTFPTGPIAPTPAKTETGSPGWRKVTSKTDDAPGTWGGAQRTTPTRTPDRTPPGDKGTGSPTKSKTTRTKAVKKVHRMMTRRLARIGEEDEAEELIDVQMADDADNSTSGGGVSQTQPWGPPDA